MTRALKAGARAYLLKGRLAGELLETIRAVHAGQKRIPTEVAAELAEHAGESGLTVRETHYVRRGDFILNMIRSSENLNEYAFEHQLVARLVAELGVGLYARARA